MLKAMGTVMIMLGAAALGSMKRSALSSKVSELERLLWETGRLRAKIQSTCLPLEDCFAQSELFAPAAQELRKGARASTAVMSCAIRAEGLGLFAAGLDAETVEGQISNIDSFIDSLRLSLTSAREELARKGKLYVGLAVLSGAAVCIILL